MARYVHALTGREIDADSDRLSRLVEADDNWSEVKPRGRRARRKSDGDSGDSGDSTDEQQADT